MSKYKVAIMMGSVNDWPVMKKAAEVLDDFSINYDAKVLSAHRTPHECAQYVNGLREQGFCAVIAGAGGAAHLPGVVAAHTILPVLGVPINATALQGHDALLAIVQMPKGIPVATFAIGEPGAGNAGLFVVSLLAVSDSDMAERLDQFRKQQASKVLAAKLP